jgi:hypothetical protein
VVVRWIPLVTAAYGTRVAWPARTTALPPGGHGSSSARGRGPSPMTATSWQEPEGLPAAGWGDSNSTAPVSSSRGQKGLGAVTCGSDNRSVSAPDRCCPWFTSRLRTQHGPTGLPVPPGRGRLQALRSSATRDRSAGRAWQGPMQASSDQYPRNGHLWPPALAHANIQEDHKYPDRRTIRN